MGKKNYQQKKNEGYKSMGGNIIDMLTSNGFKPSIAEKKVEEKLKPVNNNSTRVNGELSKNKFINPYRFISINEVKPNRTT